MASPGHHPSLPISIDISPDCSPTERIPTERRPDPGTAEPKYRAQYVENPYFPFQLIIWDPDTFIRYHVQTANNFWLQDPHSPLLGQSPISTPRNPDHLSFPLDHFDLQYIHDVLTHHLHHSACAAPQSSPSSWGGSTVTSSPANEQPLGSAASRPRKRQRTE